MKTNTNEPKNKPNSNNEGLGKERETIRPGQPNEWLGGVLVYNVV